MISDSCEPTNVFAVVLAGGAGTRMGSPDKPKQFLMLGSKPMLVHTVEKICTTGQFDAVVVMCPRTWIQQTRDILDRYCSALGDNIVVAAGGATRNDTITNALEYLEKSYRIDDESIVLTHDAVRPFVTYRIIQDNISAAQRYGACDTVIPATDTIIESENGECVTAIPERRRLYQGQTPQSFNIRKLERLIDSLTDEEKESLTDACKIFVLRGEGVALVEGEASNIKVTYPQDMRMALALLGE